MPVRPAPEIRPGSRDRVRRHWLDEMALVECRTDPFTGRRVRAGADMQKTRRRRRL
ncbi:hypothetical protein [Streptomyces sp. NPDC058335]|uniref:hypothetical protein n=1 Tax=Streptomyces sp. NPDC058335 TaxID=3346451 RepID=UPI003650617D